LVAGSVALVQILIATDADWIVDDITAALGADGVTFIMNPAHTGFSVYLRPKLKDVSIPAPAR
jgi:hypothetical protein